MRNIKGGNYPHYPVFVDSDGSLFTKDCSGIDSTTNARACITYPHHELHEGNLYSVTISTVDLDSNPLRVSFTTSNTKKWMHFIVVAETTGEGSFSLIEAPTGGVADGSAIAILNRNRNSDKTSLAVDTHTPGTANQMTKGASAATGGLDFGPWKFGSGRNKIGGGIRSLEEKILKQNTKYSCELTSTTNTITGQLTLIWYEHTNK